MKHEKKVLPEYFQAIMDGKKNYELRLADWEANEGDELVLKEWDKQRGGYTDREIIKKITYVGKFKPSELFWPKEDIDKYGFQILSLE